MATLMAAVLLLSRPAWLRRAPASPHAGKLGLVAIVAVTAIGIGGSGLAMFNLGGVDQTRVPGEPPRGVALILHRVGRLSPRQPPG